MKRFPIFYETPSEPAGGAATLIPPTPTPVPTATPNGVPAPTWIKEDGSFGDGWLNKLPEDLRGDPSLKVLPSLTDMAKSYVETKRLVGTKLEMPGVDATPERIAAWRKTVGAPDTPEGYLGDAKTVRPEAIPEEMWDAESEKAFLGIAHKHHLPPAVVKEILDFYGGNIAKSLAASGEAQTAVLAAESGKLKAAWGTEFDTNVSLASRMAKTVGLDPEKDPIFTNASAVIAFAKMGRLLSEDKLVKGETASIASTIADRIRDIQDPKSQSTLARDYRGEFGPERQAAAQTQLHELMNFKK